MNKFSIKLDSFVVSDVEALGDTGTYDGRPHDDKADYVVRRGGKEVLRVTADHILYVMITEVSNS